MIQSVTGFTGKERDAETGLDYFGARYLSAAQGRFTTPDPMMASAHVADPQSWNRYTYALNNPLKYFDPDGLKEISVEDCRKDKDCTVVPVNAIYDKGANRGTGLNDKQKQRFEKNLLATAKSDLGNAKIALDVKYTAGEINREQKTITGLDPKSLNIVATDIVPSAFTGNVGVSGALRGASYVGQGSYIELISMMNATEGSVPFFGTNTVTHETLHHLLGDTTRQNPGGWRTELHEAGMEAKSTLLHLGVNVGGVNSGAKVFTLPPIPKLNEPRK
jgi:RHS repeat-associated protein